MCLLHNDVYRLNFVPALDSEIRSKCVFWIPIEKNTINDQLTLNACKTMEHVAVVSDYASKILSAKLGKRIRAIYHQVDTKVFRPLDNKQQLKEAAGLTDKFVVIRNDRNQPRKRWQLTLDAWQIFAKDKQDVMLLAKTDPKDCVGTDLLKEAADKGISDKVMFSSGFYPAAKLNEVYNLADVFFSTTGAEGFGLALAEASAAGLPVMATDTPPIDEVLNYGQSGCLIKVSGQVWNDKMKVFYDDIDVNDAVEKLELFYTDWKSGGNTIKSLSKHAREYAVERYDVNKTVDALEAMFKEIVPVGVPFKKMSKPTIDRLLIGIVTRNRPNYLCCLLTSLLAQTYQDFDVMIIDNGDDESLIKNNLLMSILSRMDDSGHVWRLHRGSPQINCPSSHQKIFEQSNYKFIYKLDDDVLLDSYCLGYIMGVLKSDDTVAAAGGIFLDPNKPKAQQSLPAGVVPTMDVLNNNVQWYTQPTNDIIMAEHLYSSFIYRREYLEEAGGFPLNLSRLAFREETLTTYRMFKKGNKLAIVPQAIAWHFNNSNSGCHDIDWAEKTRMAQEDALKFEQQLKLLQE